MALALALIALVLVGAFVAGVSFIGLQEARIGESAGRLQRLFAVAEGGLSHVIHGWDPATYNGRPALPFDSVVVSTAATAEAGTSGYHGHVYRLNGELYFIDLTATDSLRLGPAGVGVRQRAGLLAHVRPPTPRPQAAITTGKGNHLSPQVTVDGTDRVPPDWRPCGPSDSGQVGIDSTTTAGPAAGLGGLTFARLAAVAKHTLPGQYFGARVGPELVSGRCDETVATNWGDNDPNAPCGSYFPVVHIVGDATVAGNHGQGILLVDGSLAVRGGFEWYGVVLVRGTLTVIGDPLDDIAMWGAVLVGDSAVLENAGDRSVAIQYSKCAITKALEPVATVAMLRTRGWVSLSNVP